MKIHKLLIMNFLDEYELVQKLFSTTFLELMSQMSFTHCKLISIIFWLIGLNNSYTHNWQRSILLGTQWNDTY